MTIWENLEADGALMKEEESESDCIISVKTDHRQCQLLTSERGNHGDRELPKTVSTATGRFTKPGRAHLEL